MSAGQSENLYNFLLFSDIDLGSNARSGRQGKSLDFDDYSDEDDEEEDETLETLRRLLSPSELSRLREKVFGGGDKYASGRSIPYN